MRIYFDTCCLNGPFDDPGQSRIRNEAAAIERILRKIESGSCSQVASEMSLMEIAAIHDDARRRRVRRLLPSRHEIARLTETIRERAQTIGALGFAPADAVHLAAAEIAGADVFLSCDDRLHRTAQRCAADLRIVVANPVQWLKDHEKDLDA